MKKKKLNKLLLIVTGGIASYKAIDLMRFALKDNYDIECILTNSVSNFVSPMTFNSLLGKQVYSELFSLNENSKMKHIDLSNSVDLIVVVPATANFIGKLANGIGDDLASTTILASKCPLFIAPAMNDGMFENLAVKSNIKTLRKRGVKILEPQFGKLACGTIGKGKLMDIELIYENIKSFFKKSILLKDKKAIVTSGPSLENFDPVRFISNFSSGLQGYEIAKALSNAGAKTILISGPTKIKKPSNVNIKNAITGDDFLNHSISSLPADIYISVAAISDWKIRNYQSKKIKKKNGDPLKIDLVENTDVLFEISKHNRRPKLVIGFAAETENLITNAKDKLSKKKCDWIIANKVSNKMGFNNLKNKVTIIKNNKDVKNWPNLEKSKIAEKLVKEISNYFQKIEKFNE